MDLTIAKACPCQDRGSAKAGLEAGCSNGQSKRSRRGLLAGLYGMAADQLFDPCNVVASTGSKEG